MPYNRISERELRGLGIVISPRATPQAPPALPDRLEPPPSSPSSSEHSYSKGSASTKSPTTTKKNASETLRGSSEYGDPLVTRGVSEEPPTNHTTSAPSSEQKLLENKGTKKDHRKPSSRLISTSQDATGATTIMSYIPILKEFCRDESESVERLKSLALVDPLVTITEGRSEVLSALKEALVHALEKHDLHINGYGIFRALRKVGIKHGLVPLKREEAIANAFYGGRAIRVENLPQLFPADKEDIQLQQSNSWGSDVLCVARMCVGYSPEFLIPCVTIFAAGDRRIPPPVRPRFPGLATITIYGVTLQHSAGFMHEATEIVRGDGSDERLTRVEKRAVPKRAKNDPTALLELGNSIGIADYENKGTAGIPVRGTVTGSYRILTAGHVFVGLELPDFDVTIPDLPIPRPQLTCVHPGNADVVKYLSIYLDSDPIDRTAVQNWMLCHNKPCGTTMQYELGVDNEGWRADWALVEVEEDKRGTGVLNESERLQKLLGTNNAIGLSGCRDPYLGRTDDMLVKDGATTGWTMGRLSSTECLVFLKSHALSAEDENFLPPGSSVAAKVMMVEGSKWKNFGEPGDSGASVFVFDTTTTKTKHQLSYAGQLVGQLHLPDQRRSLAIIVPGSAVFQQIEDATNESWVMSWSLQPVDTDGN